MGQHPDADLLVHPECGCAVDCLIRAQSGGFGQRQTVICSTQGMIEHAKRPETGKKFIVATETGHLYTLRKSVPGKQFIPVTEQAVCEFMKLTTLKDLLCSLQDSDQAKYEVLVPKEIRENAAVAVERMLQIT